MQARGTTDPEARLPYLEYYSEGGGARHRIVIDCSPFRIGRSKTANYTIYSGQVSKQHAEIVCADEQVRIRDLGSTNGTFVNGQRITEGALASGDILHLAHREFRFVHGPFAAPTCTEVSTTAPANSDLPASLIRGGQHLRELLEQRSVVVLFQPIVNLETQATLGYEALGRSTHRELRSIPSELFHLADQCQLAPALSQLFRKVAAEEALRLPADARVFLNLHPSERLDDSLLDSLRALRRALRDDQKMVLEVHEDVVTDLRNMHWLRDHLHQSGIELAYDDFGTGQARLAQLAEVPPRFVKLDISLVRGIDRAQARQELIQALNRGMTDLGIDVIAEGIETLEEARVCRGLGCRFGQGYLFGRPQPASLLGAG